MSDSALIPSVPSLAAHVVGDARLAAAGGGLVLVLDGASAARYSDSQLDDFHGRARDEFLWEPPLCLALRARFSHGQAALRGTAGFGWWNAPFEGDRATEVAVGPQVLWFFFGSPPNRLAATPGWSGDGWFAQGMVVPSAPGWLVELGMRLMRLPFVQPLARRAASGVSRAAEQPLHYLDITQWHEYRIEWRASGVRWLVDGATVLRYAAPPRGPLALVIWMDNQWATLDGAGGLLDPPDPQWMEVADLSVEPLAEPS